MTTFPIFLNDLSCNPAGAIDTAGVVGAVHRMLRALGAAKDCRGSIALIGPVSLTKLTLCENRYTLSSLLGGNEHKEVWRKIRSLDDRSPWSSYPPVVTDGSVIEEIRYEGKSSEGMLHAHRASSLLLSLSLCGEWEGTDLTAELHCLGNDDEIVPRIVTVPNVVDQSHIETHREIIENYGNDPSASSVVYSGDNYDIRLFFRDHNPPHFHVTNRDAHTTTIARYEIQTLRPLAGGEPPARIRREVLDWASAREESLMTNWTRCRAGKFPFIA